MGLFGKKKKEDEREFKNTDEMPELPELPRLPELPKMENHEDTTLPQLPSYPKSSFGEKFSQDAIKDAVTGEKEGDGFNPEEFGEEEIPMMDKPLKTPLTKEIPLSKENRAMSKEIETVPADFKEASKHVKKLEPIFIRIDKFEESLKIFEKAKTQISEIEKMLQDIKRIKDEEEKELNSWENEMQQMKEEIEKVDKEIFSKID
jgi:hypothetical protein